MERKTTPTHLRKRQRFITIAKITYCIFELRLYINLAKTNLESMTRLEVINIFMLNSTEHKILTAPKTENQTNKEVSLSFLDVVFIMLMNVKIPTIVVILTFMSG